MLPSLIFISLLLAACVFDSKQFRIPNFLPLALLVLSAIKLATTGGITVWPGHLLAFGLTLSVGFLAFAGGFIGGGDAKLMAAVALWLGISELPSFLVMTAISGAVLALVLSALRQFVHRGPVTAPSVGPPGRWRLLDRQAPVPYALPIAFAALWLEWF